MCGRYASTLPPAFMRQLFKTENPLINFRPRYNAAPSQELPVVRLNRKTGKRHLDLLKWGLVPHGERDPRMARRPINARCETVDRLPSFAGAFAKRRCLVPANLFFEWKGERRPKQPYAIGMKDGGPFAFAGIWESWGNPDNLLRTFAILTTTPNEICAPIHDRMPVIVGPDDYAAWLGEADADRLRAIMRPNPADLMKAWPVSTRVNGVRDDDAGLIEPVQIT